MQKRLIKAAIFIIVILLVEYFFGWRDSYEAFKHFAQTHVTPLAFICVMSFGCAAGLPVSWCYFFAATAFGVFFGWIYCLVGLFFSALLGFGMTKILLPPAAIAPMLKRFNIKTDVSEATYHANFFVRAIPGIPYFMQNIMLAEIGSKLGMYLAMTLLVQGPIALAICLFANSIKMNSFRYAIVAALLVVVLTLVHKTMRRFYFKDAVPLLPNAETEV